MKKYVLIAGVSLLLGIIQSSFSEGPNLIFAFGYTLIILGFVDYGFTSILLGGLFLDFFNLSNYGVSSFVLVLFAQIMLWVKKYFSESLLLQFTLVFCFTLLYTFILKFSDFNLQLIYSVTTSMIALLFYFILRKL